MYSQTTGLVSEGIIANIPSLNLTGKSDSYAPDSQWLEMYSQPTGLVSKGIIVDIPSDW